jgi:hypothetical protein
MSTNKLDIQWVEVGVTCTECGGQGHFHDPTGFWAKLNPLQDAWEVEHKLDYDQNAPNASGYYEARANAFEMLEQDLMAEFGFDRLPAEEQPCFECDGAGKTSARVSLEELRQALGINDLLTTLQDRGQF